MIATRWIKAWRDAIAARGRLATIVAALAASVAAVATMGVASAVLTREVPRNYLSTNPASAQIEIQGDVDAALLDQMRQLPGIAQADGAASLRGRIETGPGDWSPLVLFVVRDFATQSIATLHPEAGAWPPPTGTLLVERSALPVARHAVGDSVTIALPHGGTRNVAIAGSVHDAGVAPAGQENVVYAYATAQTMAALGEPVPLDRLRIVVAPGGGDVARIEQAVRGVAARLATRGIVAVDASVPPPRRHPHQPQMNAVLAMLTIFSALVLALGAVLAATIVGGWMAQQRRELAIMKAIGASTAQVAAPVLAIVLALSAAATAAGLALGLAAARAFVGAVAAMLNLRIADDAAPAGTLAVVVAAGLAAPLLAALVPVVAAARRTVRSAIDDHGTGAWTPGQGRLMRVLARVRLGDGAASLALRNTFRRRTRLALTLTLLAGAGAMFLASTALRSAWQDTVAQAARDRRFDVEIVLDHPAPSAAATLRAQPGVRAVEPWDAVGATVAGPDGLAIDHRYPDGGHGGFALRSTPPATTLVAHDIVEGRWLQAGDTDALVVNTMARAQDFASLRLGDAVTLVVGHRRVTLRLAGVVHESLTSGAAYVAPGTFEDATRDATIAPVLRIALADPGDADRAAPALAQALQRAGIAVRMTLPQKRMAEAQGAHVAILVVALGFIASLMAIVGLLGLASALATSASERTREFGVMKALGASRAAVARIVAVEGLVIGVLGAALALVLAWPLSAEVGRVLASISNQQLDPRSSPAATAALFVAALAGALVASIVPAWRAARWTVREALAVA